MLGEPLEKFWLLLAPVVPRVVEPTGRAVLVKKAQGDESILFDPE